MNLTNLQPILELNKQEIQEDPMTILLSNAIANLPDEGNERKRLENAPIIKYLSNT